MRPFFPILLLITLFLASCAEISSGPPPTISATKISTPPPLTPTSTRLPPTQTATSEPPTPTVSATAKASFTYHQGKPLPLDRLLIAYEAGSEKIKTLILVDKADGTSYEFKFPGGTIFATPLLAGLSPDARYFAFFKGGQLVSPWGEELLRTDVPDLVLNVLDLYSGEVIFSTSLLSSTYPKDLIPIAEMIKGDWNFTHFNDSFDEVVTATQDFLLDHIRNLAWSPDGSLLAFASQVPGPSSDLYLFDPESRTAKRLSADPGHIVRTIWAPDSSKLIMDTSFYGRMAREDTEFLLTREGFVLGMYTSQLRYFHNWFDSTYGFLYAGTDAGDYFELKLLSATDGTIRMFWEGSFDEIVFAPDMSTFLVSCVMPSAPIPPRAGLYLGKIGEDGLRTLSEIRGWGVAYWGSERFEFAASSIEGGTVGITSDGEIVTIDDGRWMLAASPNHNYLAGFYRHLPDYVAEILPGLRIFDGSGLLLESNDEQVTCVQWDEASAALAYQVEGRLFLWDAPSGTTRQIAEGLSQAECAFKWAQLEIP